jgi:hypothetical protein
VACCEVGSANSGAIKCDESFTQLRNCCLLTKDAVVAQCMTSNGAVAGMVYGRACSRKRGWAYFTCRDRRLVDKLQESLYTCRDRKWVDKL